MTRLTKWFLPVLALGLLAVSAQAGTVTILCTEDPVNGCIATIPTSDPALQVAFDGEATFRPFGLTVDVSDAIWLNADWAPDPAYASAFAKGFWTQQVDLAGAPTGVWYLPASLPCGAENEPPTDCEPMAKWDFVPGTSWSPEPGILIALEADGSVSDIVTATNGGPNGSASITFLSGVPEPGTLTLLGLGVGLVAAAKRLGKRSA